jgi:hypothetical protein
MAFLVYAVVAWVPCLVGGIFIGGALAAPETDDGITQGRTLGIAGALPEILVSTLVLLAIAYVGPVLYLNRKRWP